MKITEKLQQFIMSRRFVFIASADRSGSPHLAIGEHIALAGESLLVLENCFCPTTLQNIVENPRVSVVALNLESGSGFQLTGSVVRNCDAAVRNNSSLSNSQTMQPQILTRFTVHIETVLDFSFNIHSDVPLANTSATNIANATTVADHTFD